MVSLAFVVIVTQVVAIVFVVFILLIDFVFIEFLGITCLHSGLNTTEYCSIACAFREKGSLCSYIHQTFS